MFTGYRKKGDSRKRELSMEGQEETEGMRALKRRVMSKFTQEMDRMREEHLRSTQQAERMLETFVDEL